MFPYMGIIVILEMTTIYVMQKNFRVANREIKRFNSVEDGKLLTLINESISGTKIIRSFRRCNKFNSFYLKEIYFLNSYI
jgi:hypothetical protein